MRQRICLAAGQFDVTVAVSHGLAAWARAHQSWRIEVHNLDPANHGWIRRAGFAGLVAVNPSNPERHLSRLRFPVVCVQSPASTLPTVNVNDEAIGTLAAEHLLECGYRRFAYFGVDADWSQLRHSAFAAALVRRGATCSDNRVRGQWPAWTSAQREAHLRAFLRRGRRPVAIMACSDLFARMLLDTAVDLGLSVPEDIAVIGVDNVESLCESDRVTLSSIDPGFERLGHEAGRVLDTLLNARPLPQRLTQVSPRGVVQRRSTNVAAFADPQVAAAVRLIRASACEGITVEDVCRQLAISRRQLERRFLKHAGRLPGAEIRNLRIARARELLSDTSLPLTQIAVRCGYEHLSSFSSAFRQATGQTPSAFRQHTGQ